MKKIVLIEDEEKITKSLKYALTEEGYEVFCALDGEEGLETVRSAKPDIILLDIMLPKIDGFEVCHLLKTDPEHKSIPIIMMTALGDTENIVKGLSAGADDYVSKPFNLSEFLARVKSHLKMKELYDTVNSEKEEKSALLDFSQTLCSAVNPHETLYNIVSKLADVIEVKRCSVIYVDSLNQKGYVMASHDSKKISHLEIDLDKYPEIQKVMETGNPVIINDVFNDPILFSVKDILGMVDIKSIMAFPVTFKDSLIGTLILRTSRRESAFSDREIRFCDLISHFAASPLKNAYLFEILNTEKEQERQKRLSAEELQRASKKYSKNLIDCSLDMIISTDSHRKIVEFNQAAQQTFGYSLEEILGKEVGILYTNPEEGLKIAKVLREMGRFAGEVTNRRKNGESFPCFLSASILRDPDGKFLGFMGVSRDISNLKKSEEDLKNAKEKAENATKLKDKFVSLVAHDLKEPLGSMTASLSLARSGLKNSSDEKLKSIVNIAISSADKMMTLISDLLNLSRLKTGKMTTRLVFTDAFFLALRVLSDFKFIASQKGIELINKVPERTRIYADETLFYEVLQNLVSNAVKFSNKGDTVTLFIPNEEASTIGVRDTGTGIGRNHLKKIFSYEEKTSTSGTIGERGSGFGLPLSSDIMEAHNGSIDVESKEGKGSVFFARLPYVRPLILLADDDTNVRVLVKDYLKEEDIEFAEAENGQDAWGIIENTLPHLIITNIMMPLMDGFELLKKIRNNQKTKFLPVIMITSDSEMKTREKAFRKGANDFIVKPLIVEDLVPRVHKIIV